MYFSDVGTIALILALGFAVYTVVVAVLGAIRGIAPLVASAKRSTLTVTFFLLAGAKANLDGINNPAIYVIRPPLGAADEEKTRSQFNEFCRLLHRL